MSSSCFLYSFHYFSILIHFPWRVMLQPPVFITMSRGSKLSVSSITGSSAVATNSFTPQVEDSSGLTPWRPQLEASHPAAKLSRWRSSSDLGTDLVVESSIMRLHSAPGMKEPFVPLFSKVTLQAWTRMFAKRSTSHSYEFVGDLWLVTLWWKRCCYVPNNKLLLCFNFMVWSRYSKICKMLNVYPYRLFYHPPPSYHIKPLQGDFHNPTSASFAPSMRCDALTLRVVIATKVTTHTHSPRAHLSEAKYKNESLEPLLEIRPGACSEATLELGLGVFALCSSMCVGGCMWGSNIAKNWGLKHY